MSGLLECSISNRKCPEKSQKISAIRCLRVFVIACSRPKLQISERVLQHIIHESRYVIHEDISDFIEEIVLGVFYSQVGGGTVLSCSSSVVYTLIAGTSGCS